MNKFALALVVVGLIVAAIALPAFLLGGGSDGGDDAAGPVSSITTVAATTPGATNTPPTSVASQEVELPRDLAAVSETWTTDFSLTTIDLRELAIGIRALPIRDRIRPLDDPIYDTVTDAAEDRSGREPGLVIDLNGDARFYPFSIMTAHEIVNDVVGDVAVAVTYCPLCNSAIAFDATLDGVVHRFGVSGLLRNSDMVMWDDQTESLWQQLTGEGIVGTYAGRQLEFLPTSINSFEEFRRLHPDGLVLSEDQIFGYNYGFNSYVGYSSRSTPYGGFFDNNNLDPRLPALERVVNVTIDGVAKAYPFSVLEGEPAVNDTVNGAEIVVFWGGDTADNLDDQRIASGQSIGTGIAFSRPL